MAKQFVIFSREETEKDITHEPMFWSNKHGWTELSGADVYTWHEAVMAAMPVGSSFRSLPEREL